MLLVFKKYASISILIFDLILFLSFNACSLFGGGDGLDLPEQEDSTDEELETLLSQIITPEELNNLYVAGLNLGIPASAIDQAISITLQKLDQQGFLDSAIASGINIQLSGSAEYASGSAIILGSESDDFSISQDLFLSQEIATINLENYDNNALAGAVPGAVPGAIPNAVAGAIPNAVAGFLKTFKSQSANFELKALCLLTRNGESLIEPHEIPIYITENSDYFVYVIPNYIFSGDSLGGAQVSVALFAVPLDSTEDVTVNDQEIDELDILDPEQEELEDAEEEDEDEQSTSESDLEFVDEPAVISGSLTCEEVSITWSTNIEAGFIAYFSEDNIFDQTDHVHEGIEATDYRRSHTLSYNSYVPGSTIYYKIVAISEGDSIYDDDNSFVFNQTSSTTVSFSTITEDTVWDRCSSPYIIESDLIIPANKTLEINPGTIIKFAADKSMIVNGTLKAIGAEDNEIVFTSQVSSPTSSDYWQSVKFTSDSAEAIFNANDEYEDGSIMKYVNLYYFNKGVLVDNSSPYIAHCDFENSLYGYPSPEFNINIDQTANNPKFIFENNMLSMLNTSTFTNKLNSVPLDNTQILIRNNHFYGMDDDSVNLDNNESIAYELNQAAFIFDNNYIEAGSGYGLNVEGDMTISNNTFSQNAGGIMKSNVHGLLKITQNKFYANSVSGAVIHLFTSSTTQNPDNVNSEITYNNFMYNSASSLIKYVLGNDTSWSYLVNNNNFGGTATSFISVSNAYSVEINADDNYWDGLETLAEIQTKIDDDQGRVVVDSWLTDADETAAAAGSSLQ
jgi:hypothetical protein